MGTALTKYLAILLTLLFVAVAMAESPSSAKGKFLGAKETVYPAWFKESFLDLREDILEATEMNRRVMIFFHQAGCPYCNLMVEKNLSQKTIRDRMQSHLDLIEFNMWGDREVTGLSGENLTEKEFAAAMRVQFTPTVLAFDEQGKVILRLNGYIPPHQFNLALDYIIEKHEQQLSYREFLAEHRTQKAATKLNAQPFFNQALSDLSNRANRPLAVFFEQTQCPACDTAHQVVFNTQSVQTEIDPFEAIQLDMWSNREIIAPDGRRLTARQWADELGVTYAPTLVLFNENDREIIRAEAYFKKFHTAGILHYVASKAYAQQPSFQRYLSERAEHIRESGKDVDIWQ